MKLVDRRTFVWTMWLFPVALLGAPAEFPAADACPPSWTYQKQREWGGTCEAGKRQSPVDIGSAAATATLTPIAFAYRAFPLAVMNTSRVFEVPDAANCSITANQVTATLQQFHFHFPSEHQVRGVAFAGELHLVHAAPNNQLAVVGVFIARGAHNNSFDPIVALAKDVAACRTSKVQGAINPAPLVANVRDYVTYAGSLTTPPCSETVTWYVAATPITASEEQIRILKSIGPSSRTPQPLNGRMLSAYRR